MWIKIHPEDNVPFAALIDVHLNNRSYNKAIKVGHQAEQAGHNKIFLFRITSLYAKLNNKEKVEEYLIKYQKAFPDDDEIEKKMGKIYHQQYLYKEAISHYNAYNTLNPLDINNNVQTAYCLFQLSEYDESIELLENLLPKAKNYSDSLSVFYALENQHTGRGEIKMAIALMNERHTFSEKHIPLLGRVQQKASGYYFRLYHKIGEHEQSKKNIEVVGKLSKEYEEIALANYYLATEDGQRFNELLADEKKFLEKNSSPELFAFYEGIAKKFNQNYEAAIQIFEKQLEKKSDVAIELYLYDCYRHTQQYDEAVKGYEKFLKKMPFYGEALLRYAQCLNDSGQVDAAKEELKKLMDLWKNADPEFIFYQEAIELDKQINLDN